MKSLKISQIGNVTDVMEYGVQSMRHLWKLSAKDDPSAVLLFKLHR
jgi:hypothetical protein